MLFKFKKKTNNGLVKKCTLPSPKAIEKLSKSKRYSSGKLLFLN